MTVAVTRSREGTRIIEDRKVQDTRFCPFDANAVLTMQESFKFKCNYADPG